MRNLWLINRSYSGKTIPELWYMYTRHGSIFIVFTELCWSLLQGMRIPDEYMRPDLKEKWGGDNVFPPVRKTRSKNYMFEINIKNQIDPVGRKSIANSLSYLTSMLDIDVVVAVSEKRSPHKGEQIQLFSMETYFREDAPFHGAAMDISISPEAAEFLVAHSHQEIPGVQKAMRQHNNALYPRDKRKSKSYFGTDLTGVIREKGTLRFITSGNCACLGQMPEMPEKDEGLYLDSHNLDTSWQQLSMIVGVAETWKWVRDSLGYT